jgi:hypothetical protein
MPIPDRIRGTLHLQFATNGTIAFVFMPGREAGSSPLLAKNIETAEEDLVRTWGFTPSKAETTIDELKLRGHVHRDIDADAGMVAKLFSS